MIRIAIIVGSTRPGRKSGEVAEWFLAQAVGRTDASLEIVDIADQRLPLLDEPMPPARGHYANQHTRRWAETINAFDGFVFVAPEYNHSVPAALKNAIDFLYTEWGNKAAGFVTFGVSHGGVRAAEHLRLILAELSVAPCGRRWVCHSSQTGSGGPPSPRGRSTTATSTPCSTKSSRGPPLLKGHHRMASAAA